MIQFFAALQVLGAQALDYFGDQTDVINRARDERGVFIDDRDEWEEHRVRYGYPADIVLRLEQVAIDLEAAVRAAAPPYDEATAAHWLGVLTRLAP